MPRMRRVGHLETSYQPAIEKALWRSVLPSQSLPALVDNPLFEFRLPHEH
jgi:hypothetical protein